MMSLRRLNRPVVLVPLATLAIGGAFVGGVRYEREAARGRDEWGDARLLSTAIDSVRANALDSLPSDELIRRAVSGMLRELHDPYAALLRPEGYARYRGSLQGAGQGLGLVMRRDGSSYRVTRVAPGSPALVAGVRAGDRILAADGVPVWAAPGAAARAGDSTRLAGSRVHLTLWRAPYGDTVHVTVQRGAWHMPAVSEQGMLADSVAYVRLATISARSSDELEQVVDGLRRRGARALVLDLRGNAGGLFEEGVRAAGLFLPRGAIVSSLMGRGGAEVQPYRVRHSRWTELPLTVLVDGRTASAAEVIAAALQDHGRALLVGAPTFGKGLVQRVVRLSPELSLRLTTARWLTPRGVALERRTGRGTAARGGLTPDVLLDDPSRADPSAAPDGWSGAASRRAVALADTLAMRALRERWAVHPLSMLEARLRDSIAHMVPPPDAAERRGPKRGGRARAATARATAYAEWLAITTRMAMARVLEVERDSEALLWYAAREDAAIRAGLDVVAPGLLLSRR